MNLGVVLVFCHSLEIVYFQGVLISVQSLLVVEASSTMLQNLLQDLRLAFRTFYLNVVYLYLQSADV